MASPSELVLVDGFNVNQRKAATSKAMKTINDFNWSQNILAASLLFPSRSKGFRVLCGGVSQHPDHHHLPRGRPCALPLLLLGHGQRWRLGPRAPLPPPAGPLLLPRPMPRLAQPQPRLQPLVPWLGQPGLQLWLPPGGGGGAQRGHHQLRAVAVLQADLPRG